ncbi:glycoside hydrolase family 15 protein [Polychaeton citri CBS 116435]|uniref:glucan 1,4-alpha-glucosidase n=1 Tax=Polychaeton citri CBS 116435 TaxID=1314669 RepID=A0A9P4US33_9PEZI|nr:glycoside hydrolase family 15 protein [Polychaeton citri CBS 116435]
MKGLRINLVAGLAALVTSIQAQDCVVQNLRTSPPPAGTNVSVKAYSYCGGVFNISAYVANLCYNKVVTVYYTNKQNVSTPLTTLSLGYQADAVPGQIELWGARNTGAYIDGVDTLLNITFQAVDIGETYSEVLGLPIEASGAPEPTLPTPPKPYATPIGFGSDITKWLAVGAKGSEADISFTRMFLNINPDIPGSVNGSVVAARSGPLFPDNLLPDYTYTWVRDTSLTHDVTQKLYAAATKKSAKSQYEQILFGYAGARYIEQNDPNLQTGLGEPKFYLNQTIFTGPWGRPQNDGPATAAITLIEFANDYLAAGGSLNTVKTKIWNQATAPVQRDLLFVASNWTYASFDLWEEEPSDHFYTRMVQRKALLIGADFATKMGDATTSSTLKSAAAALTATLPQFWDPNRKTLLYEYGPVLRDKSSYLDVAVVLGVIHGYNNDGVYSYTNDQVLSSALRIATSFIPIYGVANTTKDSSGRTLGIPIGRYPEDVYNGTDTQENGGNPWYLATNALGQLMYSAASEYKKAGSITVTDTSKPFFDYFAPAAKLQAGQTYSKKSLRGIFPFGTAIASLEGWGDAFLRRSKFETPANGHLAEEFNRNTGAPQGAADLTWSYASVLTAAFARADLLGDRTYVTRVANKGVQPNTSA